MSNVPVSNTKLRDQVAEYFCYQFGLEEILNRALNQTVTPVEVYDSLEKVFQADTSSSKGYKPFLLLDNLTLCTGLWGTLSFHTSAEPTLKTPILCGFSYMIRTLSTL